MKKIILAGALTVFATTQAFAQAPYGYYGGYGYYGSDVVVADGGRVVGRDPDPNVRLELLRTAQTSDNYNY